MLTSECNQSLRARSVWHGLRQGGRVRGAMTVNDQLREQHEFCLLRGRACTPILDALENALWLAQVPVHTDGRDS